MPLLAPERFWQTLDPLLRAHTLLNEPSRWEALEAFRQQLIAWGGEEPTISMFLRWPVHRPEDVADVSLVEYVGAHLNGSHAALYAPQPDGSFRCVASFGHHQETLRSDGLLLPWLRLQGILIRSELTLQELSVSQAEALLGELDVLRAEVVIPCGVADDLLAVFVLGPPLLEPYGDRECLRMSLYSLAMSACRRRQMAGDLSRHERHRRAEAETLRRLTTLWAAVKPAAPLSLLILDEMPGVVSRLCRYFNALGFSVRGTTTEVRTRELLQVTGFDSLILDLSLRQRMPLRLLDAVATHAPQALLLGMTTGFSDHAEAVAREFGVTRIFRKPLRLTLLASALLEMALDRHIGSTSTT